MKLLSKLATAKEASMARATTTKKCTRCQKRRKVDNFYRDKWMKDGLSSWCKACSKAYDMAYSARKKAEKAEVAA
jgi:hypothetical protein